MQKKGKSNIMISNELITDSLMTRFKNKELDSKLEKNKFYKLFKEAIKDYYPQLKKEYARQSIYGISFEISNIIQKVYANDFDTFVYFNTEEMYAENIEDCDEDEKDYYRFEPWAEWNVVSPKTTLFEKVRDYLKQNSLKLPSDISEYADELSKEAVSWYEENELYFEEAFEEESEQIRMWVAETLGNLRKEGFWEEQGNADIYVIPFSGEGDIDYEEMVQTFRIMDQDCHGSEFLDYLAEQEE